MENSKLSKEAIDKVPEFVKLVKEHLAKSGVQVEESVLKDALLKSQEKAGCDQCSGGMRW
jgi:hypothetical protein